MRQETGYPAINIAVVGHTNTGKTSLIRTLLRDDCFGNIDESAGTTRYVEKSTVSKNTIEEKIQIPLTFSQTTGFEKVELKPLRNYLSKR